MLWNINCLLSYKKLTRRNKIKSEELSLLLTRNGVESDPWNNMRPFVSVNREVKTAE